MEFINTSVLCSEFIYVSTCGVVVTDAGTGQRKFEPSCEVMIDKIMAEEVINLL